MYCSRVRVESFLLESRAQARSRRRGGEHLPFSMSSVLRRSLTLEILDACFDDVVPLERYLYEILKLPCRSSNSPDQEIPAILADDEPQSYRDLLNAPYVGLGSGVSVRPSFMVASPLMYIYARRESICIQHTITQVVRRFY